MENEFMNRGYLLPEGCKDLIDAWKLKGLVSWSKIKSLPAIKPGKGATFGAIFSGPGHWTTHSIPLKAPHYKGMLMVPAQVSVLQLATMLNQNMSRIYADLIEMGGLAAIKEQLDFETVSKIAWKYGFLAKKAKE